MGLLIDNTLAKSLVNFSSPSDGIREGILLAAGEAKLRANKLAQQHAKTAVNSAESAMLQGASAGIAFSALPAAALFLSPAVVSPTFRVQKTLPILRSITAAAASSVPITLASEAAAQGVSRWVSQPMLERAEKLKDTPGAEGGALQVLAIFTKWATVWLTEVPRLALAAVYLSTAIVCGLVGAIGGLAYYGVMNVLAAFRRTDNAATPPAAGAPADNTDVPAASSPAPEVPAATRSMVGRSVSRARG